HKLWAPPLVVMILVGGVVSGLIGLGTGYLTLRLRGTFFGIATLAMSVVAIATARGIEHSRLGVGFATIRDDELAAEASGVPTLRLKLIATVLSGGFMGMAGALLPYYVTYLDPASAFDLGYAVNTIAMALIGGTEFWLGPILGAILIGTLQQLATVMLPSAFSQISLLIVGVML